MTAQNNLTGADTRVKELEEENELLLLQLHQVQEELEQYFLKCRALEKGQGAPVLTGGSWVDDELPEALAEAQRLSTLVDVQAKAHELEAKNALNVRLGNILIESVESGGSLIGVPAKLLKIWRQSNQQQAPESLGGKDFGKVIAAFDQGGFDAVQTLFAAAAVLPGMKANAWTALARHLKHRNAAQAAEAARCAYNEDPKAYRLKWLAFKLHEAGDVLEADAMLDVLPQDTNFSDSESRQVNQIRYESKRARLRDAQKKCRLTERRTQIESQLKELARVRDEQAKLAAERHTQIEALKQAQAKLEQEKTALAGRHDEQARLAAERHTQIEALKQAQAKFEQEKTALTGRHDEQAKLAAERLKQINELQQQTQSRHAGEAELSARQQMMHEEMVRAEAQLDLIKDMLLREPGL